jgi:hypothetical protein
MLLLLMPPLLMCTLRLLLLPMPALLLRHAGSWAIRARLPAAYTIPTTLPAPATPLPCPQAAPGCWGSRRMRLLTSPN